jgi:hypothetical protein
MNIGKAHLRLSRTGSGRGVTEGAPGPSCISAENQTQIRYSSNRHVVLAVFRIDDHPGVSSGSTLRNLASDPAINACFPHVERQASSTEDLIMERLNIEVGTKLLLCAFAEHQNLLADFVTEALSRPRDIPVDFSLNRRLIGGAAFAEVSHCLFPSPGYVTVGLTWYHS